MKEVSWKAISKADCSNEFEEMKKLTMELHNLESALQESSGMNEGTKNEVCSMLSRSMHVTLEP